MYISSKHKRVEGEKKIETGFFIISSNNIERSLGLLMAETEFRFRRHRNGLKEEISCDKERRDFTKLISASSGDTKAPADGRRFLGGKARGETAIEAFQKDTKSVYEEGGGTVVDYETKMILGFASNLFYNSNSGAISD